MSVFADLLHLSQEVGVLFLQLLFSFRQLFHRLLDEVELCLHHRVRELLIILSRLTSLLERLFIFAVHRVLLLHRFLAL